MKSIQITENVPDKIVQFLRNRDYEFLVELGEGACGKTVLLRDKYLNELFVCKKYQPYDETERPVLFEHFVRETKILYKLHHPKVVRVFNSYLYPEKFAGYILMEYVDGSDIDVFIRHTPDAINDLFVQAVDGFAYLEKCGVLHRNPARIRAELLYDYVYARPNLVDSSCRHGRALRTGPGRERRNSFAVPAGPAKRNISAAPAARA